MDASSRVRAAALEGLAAFDEATLAAFFLERCEAEESPLAKAAAATALADLTSP